MMRSIKKYLAVILTLLLALTSCPLSALAETVGADTPDYSYEYDEETDTLCFNGNYILLQSCGKLPLYQFAFSHLIIGKDVKYIKYDKNASSASSYSSYFYSRRSFDIQFEEGSALEKIDAEVFRCSTVTGTLDLTNCTNLTEIGSKAFYYSCISSVILPSSVKNIGAYAFANTNNLSEFIIDENSSDLVFNDHAFDSSAISEITIPAGVKDLGQYAFNYCKFLENITFETRDNGDGTVSGLKSLKYPFKGTIIKELVLPETIQTLSNFNDMTYLKRVDLSKTKITYLPLFTNDSALEEIIFPEDRTVLINSDNLFKNCTSLKSFTFNDNVKIAQTGTQSSNPATPDNIFMGCTSLEYVKLQDDLKTIPTYIFSGCTSLKTVVIPETVVKIEPYAFYNCESLVLPEIPSSIKKIEDHAFYNCKNLGAVINGVEKIYENAFAYSGVKEVTFDNDSNSTLIRSYAFYNCDNLTTVNLPNSISEDIPTYCFYSCDALEYIKIPVRAVAISSYCFAECKNLKRVAFDYPWTPGYNPKLTSIGTGAFMNCSSLEEIIVPNTVKTVKSKAFLNCRSLPYFNFEDLTLTSIGSQAFKNCNLQEVNLQANLNSIGAMAFMNNAAFDTLVLYSNGNIIGANAFLGCNIKNVTIYNHQLCFDESHLFDNVEHITSYVNSTAHKYAVENNIDFISLGTINIPVYTPTSGTIGNGEWHIDGKTMYINCTGAIAGQSKDSALLYYDNGNGNDYINIAKVIDDYDIENIVIGEGVTSLPGYFLYSKTDNLKSVKSITLPSTLTTIGGYAFYKTNLKSITIPDKVTSIGNYSFYYANLSNGINIGSGVVSIGDYAFYGCNFSNIEIPENVTSFGSYTFSACFNLKEFYIPSTVTNFGNYAVGYDDTNSVMDDIIIIVEPNSKAHDYCIGKLTYKLNVEGECLTGYIERKDLAKWIYKAETKTCYVYPSQYNILDYYDDNKATYFYSDGTLVEDGELEVDTLIVCEGVTQISVYGMPNLYAPLNPKHIELPSTLIGLGKGAFGGLTRLKTITIPDSVTEIYSNAFDGCTSLEAISFGRGTTTIPNDLFKNNKTLKYIDFGESVQNIGSGAFQNCTALEEIVIPSNIIRIGDNAFNKCLNVKSITLEGNYFSIGEGAFANLPMCDTINIESYDNSCNGGINRSSIFKNLGNATTGVTLNFTDDCRYADLYLFNETKIVEINFGSNVEMIFNKELMPDLKTINVDENNTDLISIDGCLYSTTDDGLMFVLAPTLMKEVNINENTVAISENAFYASDIEHIDIPEGVTTIMENAFRECTKLRKVRLPHSLETIRESAFEGCSKLKIVDIPSAEYINDYAFKNCTNLSSILLPCNLLVIGEGAFFGCTSLRGVVIPEGVNHIMNFAFADCTSLTELYVWNADLNDTVISGSDCCEIHTPVGSAAFAAAREYSMPYVSYTDEDIFYDQCAMKENIYEGYIGFCDDGHGDIQYLTVYEPSCTQDGYIIGVCEYCSVVLEEIHLDACGHSYINIVSIPATATTQGVEKYECENCGETYTTYSPALDNNSEITSCLITGTVVIANDTNADCGNTPLADVDITLNGEIIATTDNSGVFSCYLNTGVYELVLHYNYGFDRVIYLVVENEDINIESAIPIIACDWNKDGVINDDDYTLFRYVIGSNEGSPSYLSFVDMNNDGRINVKDLVYMNNVKGLDSSNFTYPNIIIGA